MSEWKDISTAPKDGRRIIAYIPYQRKRFSEVQCMDVAWWDANFNCWRFFGEDGPNDIQPTKWHENLSRVSDPQPS